MSEQLTQLYVLGGSHGNEELGKATVVAVHGQGWPNVHTRIADPEAAAEGERACGSKQIMGEYPGSLKSDNPDAVAAAANLAWLGNAQGSPAAQVLDIHNNYTPGLDYAGVGPRALKANIVAAYLLGYNRITVSPGPFYATVPNGMAIEQSLQPRRPEYAEEQAARLCRGIGQLASMRTTELTARYQDIAPQMEWYFTFEIPTTDPAGELATYIPRLERTLLAQPFAPVDVSADTRRALGIPGADQLYGLSWNHDNMSKLLPELGQSAAAHETGARREFFGGVALKLPPPTAAGEWVQFAVEPYVTPIGQQQ